MRRKERKLLAGIVISIAFLATTFTAAFLTSKPTYVEVPNTQATIRLPGEFEGEATISYNSKYVEQSEKDSILTLTFKKQGYYECSVDGNKYVFEVLNMDKSSYTIDLIEKEKYVINVGVLKKSLLVSVIIWICCFAVYICINFVSKLGAKKIEKHGVE